MPDEFYHLNEGVMWEVCELCATAEIDCVCVPVLSTIDVCICIQNILIMHYIA